MTILQLRNRRRILCLRRNPILRLLMLSFIPDTRPLLAAGFSLLSAWVGPGRGVSLSFDEGYVHDAWPRVRWSTRCDPPTLDRRILTSSTSRRAQQRALRLPEACSVGALADLRRPPWRRGMSKRRPARLMLTGKPVSIILEVSTACLEMLGNWSLGSPTG